MQRKKDAIHSTYPYEGEVRIRLLCCGIHNQSWRYLVQLHFLKRTFCISYVIFSLSVRARVSANSFLSLKIWSEKKNNDTISVVRLKKPQIHMCHAQHIQHIYTRTHHTLFVFSDSVLLACKKKMMMIMIMNNVRIRLNSERLCALFFSSNKFTYRSICVYASEH